MLVMEWIRRHGLSLRSDNLDSVGELYPKDGLRQLVVAPSRRRQPLSPASASSEIIGRAVLLGNAPKVVREAREPRYHFVAVVGHHAPTGGLRNRRARRLLCRSTRTLNSATL